MSTQRPANELLVDTSSSGIVEIRLNRPSRRNAIDGELVTALCERLEALAARSDCRLIVLRGEGGSFCAGADLEWMAGAGADHAANARALARMLRLYRELPRITIALVEGVAFGTGAALVAASDVAVAVEGTRFGFSEVRNGLLPALVSPFVLQLAAPRVARNLLVTGRTFAVAEARQIGLIDEIVANSTELEAAGARLRNDLFACEPTAVATTKRLIDAVADRPVDAALLEDLAQRTAKVLSGPQGQEGLRAFVERRKPGWARKR